MEIGNKFKDRSINKYLLILVFYQTNSDTTKEDPFFYDPLWEEHAAVVNECEADGYEED